MMMKKRESEIVSLPSSSARSNEHRRAGLLTGSPFSLSRFLSNHNRGRHHTKSRLSLDSESTRSESSLAAHTVVSSSLPVFQSGTGSGATVLTNYVSGSNRGISQVSGGCSDTASLASGRQGSNGDGGWRECPVCLTEHSADNFPPIQTCHHRSCLQCLRQYLLIEITESRVNIACPECNERFHPNDMRTILEDDVLMGKYEDFMLRRVLAMDPDTRWCPAPDCGYAVIASGCAGCPKLKCEREGCDTYFCYHCKQRWHPNQTCDAARAERSPNIRSASISYSHESNSQNEIKPCPRCGAFIVKMNDGSCNHMTCAVCAAEFCWLCMKEISDLHYLSPSGCTFWGRKPWSRKKKILWQLGTLVGAPIGITLVAGIAVPAMIIGIPVWVGRKIHARYGMASRHKRNLAVTGGVVASILASPIIAGLAVGIGVPILLAYVYGVVPISLCRSGGCGVTTTNTGGVRFEFDEENEANAQGNYTGDNHSETMPTVPNPSIAPSIGDASLGMTNSLSASSSHMERVGILRDADSDRDSASNRAIAGASLSGSICGSTSYNNKLEVQADVVAGNGTHKRASVSSESANLSLSEKSATVSFDETAIRTISSDGHASVHPGHSDMGDGQEEEYPETFTSDGVSCVLISCGTSLHSPRSSCRGLMGHEDGRHGTKCKKLTRFMDDISASYKKPSSPGCSYLGQGGDHGDDHWSGQGKQDHKTEGDFRREEKQAPGEGSASVSQQPDKNAATLKAKISGCAAYKFSEGELEPASDNAVSRISIGSDTASGSEVLPEVDTDKPVAACHCSNTDAEDQTSLGDRFISLSCSSSLDILHGDSLESTAAGKSKQEDGASSSSLRRHSYELASRHGRISPSQEEPH